MKQRSRQLILKKPQFDVVDLDIDLGMKVDPASMATNINDATKTEVSFKEDYDFSKEGTVEVIIQVKDKGNNVTEKINEIRIYNSNKYTSVNEVTQEKFLLYVD